MAISEPITDHAKNRKRRGRGIPIERLCNRFNRTAAFSPEQLAPKNYLMKEKTMKKRNRKNVFVSAFALLLMLATVLICFASCNNKKTPNKPEGTTPAQDEDNNITYPDYEGRKFRVMQRLDFENEFWAEGYNNNTINDAVYERNSLIESRYHVLMEVSSFIQGWGATENDSQFNDRLTVLMNTGEDAYDLVVGAQCYTLPFVMNDWFLDWNEIPNVDLESNVWRNGINDTMLINGRIGAITGDIAITFWKHMSAIVFNPNMVRDVSERNIYDVVAGGDWTFEYMKELCEGISRDANGDGIWDGDDIYGFASDWDVAMDAWAIALDAPSTRRNSEGWFDFTVADEKAISVGTALVDLFKSHLGYNYPGVDPSFYFRNRQAAFVPMRMEMIERLADCDIDYGVIPYPKWNKDQEKYQTSIVDGVSMLFVPKMVPDAAFIGTITQALAEESYKKVIPEYYDVVLKGKSTRDVQSWEMLDLIRDNVVVDFGYIYHSYLDEAPLSFRRVVGSMWNSVTGRDDVESVATDWARRQSEAEKHLKELYDYYFKNN